jgi:Fur family ferric uptake transcriptional regulator
VDVESLLSRLQAAGYRDTGPRRAVVEAISRRGGAFTVQEVVEELAGQGIGRATVFRTVNTLEELGYVSRLHVGEGCDRYALCDGSHHHHLVCTGCGEVFPLEECGVEAAAAAAASRVGFQVEGHHVDVYGRCATCSEVAAG